MPTTCTKRKIPVLILTILVAAVGTGFSQEVPADAPYKNAKAPVETRVRDLLGRMTAEEKASLLSGANWMQSVAIPRLGIPSIKMADGPAGIRNWTGPSSVTNSSKTSFTSTSFPSGIALAATWDPATAQSVGQAIGQEMRAIGRDMILGPTVNIQRVPLWGRNFEGYGEDPYLTAHMSVAYINGVQSEGVIATVKHFAANNEEFERHRMDEAIDERTLQEIYFPAFRAAVEAGVWSVMSAYQKINGVYCAENPSLLKKTLKEDWAFKGFVVSDWGSTYSTAPTVNAGMDLEMPGGEAARTWLTTDNPKKSGNGGDWLSTAKVMPELAAGRISPATLDDNVSRILRILFVSGIFDRPQIAPGEIDTPAQRAVARHAAAESIVLLKNAGNLLPLDPSKIKTLAVIGPNAAVAATGGGGSSLVRSNHVVSPLDGIKERAGKDSQIAYALGATPFSTTRTGAVTEDEEKNKETPEAREQLRKEAVDLASKVDAVILIVGDNARVESEGFDRKTLDLPAGQDELIQAVAKANHNTVVVFNAGAPVNVSRWVNQVPAVVDAWFGGQEMGHAIADVLFGDVNPSGKLPFSFINDFKESPAFGHYPGEDLHVKYAEGIYVGYRYFDKNNIKTQYPFGYGLSYTDFEYSDLKIEPGKDASAFEVSMQLRNRGARAGAEVVQLYVHDGHASVDRPVKELKGFQRVELAPGKSATVSFMLDKSSLAFFSTQKKDWVAEPGTFDVLLGSSSADIRLKGSLELQR
ncbi:MAG TPA: glycoside hydrolase family 3 C-terminal domain-containing protein [Terriglobales bacterium]|nr:glycoside hydrolase family 3 C-terminal domain-containing protein [Terriglobales bacterium]